jgi:triosephosphate isomerase (TIM)
MKYIVANWKMNMTEADITKWLAVFAKSNIEKYGDKKILLAPSELYLAFTKTLITQHNVTVCAQDVTAGVKGPHTGDTGAFQLKDLATYAIVGHSERQEPKETVLKKRDACLLNGITPITCFGNSQEAGDYYKEGALLAWEDPQTISVSGIYRAKDPRVVAQELATIAANLPDQAVVLYGGSVNRDNITYLAEIPQISGYLVGNASLDPLHFCDIIERA